MGIFDKKNKKATLSSGPKGQIKPQDSEKETGVPLSEQPVIHKQGPDKKIAISKTHIVQNNSIPGDRTTNDTIIIKADSPAPTEKPKPITPPIENANSDSRTVQQPTITKESTSVDPTNSPPKNTVRRIDDDDDGEKSWFDKLNDFFGDKAPKPEKPSTKNSPYSYGYGYGYGYGYANQPTKPVKPPEPKIEEKPIIMLVVENSDEVRKYKTEVLEILKKIVDSNSGAFFSLAKTGKDTEFSKILDINDIRKKVLTFDPISFTESNKGTEKSIYIFDTIFDDLEKEKSEKSENSENSKDSEHSEHFSVKPEEATVNLPEALEHINSQINGSCTSFAGFIFKSKKYRINSISVILVGTGATDDIEKTRSELNKIKSSKKLKGIKYFCINDSQVVDLASMGFPVIGHIESNFYK